VEQYTRHHATPHHATPRHTTPHQRIIKKEEKGGNTSKCKM
jgi:hypothetical protein